MMIILTGVSNRSADVNFKLELAQDRHHYNYAVQFCYFCHISYIILSDQGEKNGQSNTTETYQAEKDSGDW